MRKVRIQTRISFVQTVLVICCTIVLSFTIWQYVRVIFNSWFTVDDYLLIVQSGGVYTSFFERLFAALHFSRHMYLTWQGCFFEEFLIVFLNPFTNGRGAQADGLRLHLFLLVVMLSFFLALWLFVANWLTALFKTGKIIILVIYTCLVVALMNTGVHKEVFQWFVGVCAYTIPLAVMLLGWAVAPWWHKGRRWIIVSCVCFVMSCGAKLLFVIPQVIFALLLILYCRTNRKSFFAKGCLISSVILVSGAINVIAPGYHQRQIAQQSVTEGALFRSLYRAANHTLFHIIDETDKIINDSPIGVICVALIIIGMHLHIKEQITTGVKMGLILIGAIMPFLSLFPVLLGYGVEGLPGRVVFVLHLHILFLLFGLCLWGGMTGRRLFASSNRLKEIQYILIIMMLLQITSNNNTIRRLHDETHAVQIPVMRIYTALDKGYPQQFYSNVINVAEHVESSEKEVVTVYLDSIVEPETSLEFLYSNDDGSYRVITGMAEYYDKKEIIVIDGKREDGD